MFELFLSVGAIYNCIDIFGMVMLQILRITHIYCFSISSWLAQRDAHSITLCEGLTWINQYIVGTKLQ
jgi:hypothetical protein